MTPKSQKVIVTYLLSSNEFLWDSRRFESEVHEFH